MVKMDTNVVLQKESFIETRRCSKLGFEERYKNIYIYKKTR